MLREAGLKTNAPKSKFCTDETEYLGYILTRTGIKPQLGGCTQTKKGQSRVSVCHTHLILFKFMWATKNIGFRRLGVMSKKLFSNITTLSARKTFSWFNYEIRQNKFNYTKILALTMCGWFFLCDAPVVWSHFVPKCTNMCWIACHQFHRSICLSNTCSD